MFNRRSLLVTPFAALLAAPCAGSTEETLPNELAQPDFPYGKPRGQYPQPEFIRDSLRLHFGSALKDKSNLFRGWDENIVAIGMAPSPIGKTQLKSFYSAVFREFPDFRLVDDALLVAGDMGAHRYHALGTHAGGDAPTGKQIMFRGQTIYRVNASGRVVWRHSNHDHNFREAQLAYDENIDDHRLARTWAPDPFEDEAGLAHAAALHDGLTERDIRSMIAEMTYEENHPELGLDVFRRYSEEAKVYGLIEGMPLQPSPLSKLRSRQGEWRNAAPNLKIEVKELIVCGNFAILSLDYSGDHSAEPINGKRADGDNFVLREQTIFRFDNNRKIVERWINHDQALFNRQFS